MDVFGNQKNQKELYGLDIPFYIPYPVLFVLSSFAEIVLPVYQAPITRCMDQLFLVVFSPYVDYLDFH